jgi:hypothetical protein
MYDENDSKFLNQLTLSSDKSNINLEDRLVINNLNLKLANSSLFDSKKAEIRGLTLDVDDNSTIKLSGSGIKNLK